MRHVIVGTAGHIDHGKTSLVRRWTGIDTDRLPEEKARGITLDLGFAHWTDSDWQFAIIDVPGHERFIHNMVAGATGIDLALLVVAADDGVMPQTLEHLEIMELLGIRAGCVAITKIDLVEPEYVELVRAEIEDRTRGTFLEGCPVVPVSSTTGDGFDRLQSTLLTLARQQRWTECGELFRMPIDRVFSSAGHGTIVTGSILSGSVRPGDLVELLPSQESVRVRSVQNHGVTAAVSGARQRTAINLAGVRTSQLARGFELAAPGFLQPAQRLLVELRCLGRSPVALKDRQTLQLHLGTRVVAARVILKGEQVPPGSRCFAELRTAEPIVATYGQRFILRRPSPALTMAGGTILDPQVTGRHTADSLRRRGEMLLTGDLLQRLSLFCAERDEWDEAPLTAAWKTGVPPSRWTSLVAELTTSGEILEIGTKERGPRIHRDRLAELGDAILKRVRAELQQQRPRRALPRATIVSLCEPLARVSLLEGVLDYLRETKQLVAVGPHLGPADLQVQLTKNQQRWRSQMLAEITQGQWMPPTLKELSATLKQPVETLQPLLQLCVDEELLVALGDGFYFTPAALNEAREVALRVLSQQTTCTLSELREAWGISRKYAFPLGEYFDQQQVTIRDGDLRRAGPRIAGPRIAGWE